MTEGFPLNEILLRHLLVHTSGLDGLSDTGRHLGGRRNLVLAIQLCNLLVVGA